MLAIGPLAAHLVSAQYLALLRTENHDAERTLLAAVAPGGTFLVVHHLTIDADRPEPTTSTLPTRSG